MGQHCIVLEWMRAGSKFKWDMGKIMPPLFRRTWLCCPDPDPTDEAHLVTPSHHRPQDMRAEVTFLIFFYGDQLMEARTTVVRCGVGKRPKETEVK